MRGGREGKKKGRLPGSISTTVVQCFERGTNDGAYDDLLGVMVLYVNIPYHVIYHTVKRLFPECFSIDATLGRTS